MVRRPLVLATALEPVRRVRGWPPGRLLAACAAGAATAAVLLAVCRVFGLAITASVAAPWQRWLCRGSALGAQVVVPAALLLVAAVWLTGPRLRRR